MKASNRTVLSAVAHGSIFLNATLIAVAIPAVLFLSSDDEVVRENAREALNFHFAMWLGWAVAIAFSLILVGLLAFPILGLLSVIVPLVAILSVLQSPDTPYAYPISLPLL